MDQPNDIPFEDNIRSTGEEIVVNAADDDGDPNDFEETLRFVANWNRLVSMTNWEKGKIISLWRAALIEEDASIQTYSDEAWSKLVGNVSGQHVGRLRRVFDRFGENYEQYPNLFWSHFQASLDWEDAEMWLEGAVQNQWSVAQMRSQRWESIGAPADKRPKAEDIVVSELDEDVDPRDDSELVPEGQGLQQGERGTPFDPDAEYDDSGSLDAVAPEARDLANPSTMVEDEPMGLRAFQGFPEMPADLEDAFESVKIAILNHKLTDWRDVRPDVVLEATNALKALVLGSGE